MDIPILFEDESFFVVNKPPGVVVNRAESVKVPTIQDWVEERVSVFGSKLPGMFGTKTDDVTPTSDFLQPTTIQEEFISRSGVVHRIDKETSGILLIAKTPQAFFALKEQFMNRTIHKAYRAIVHGKMPTTDGEIKAPVGRLPWNREHFGIVPDGKEAVTRYHVLAELSHEAKKQKEVITYLEARPETGRTHQIRVHLKYLNHPIVGDYLYAGRKTSRDDRMWVPRVMLHAYEVTFSHPVTKQEMKVNAPVPEDMETVLKTLGYIEK